MSMPRTSGRTRRRRHGNRPAIAVLAGAITIGLIAGFIWLSENAYNGLPLVKYRYLNVTMPNIGHLQVHDEVEMAGVEVGQVLRTTTHAGRAVVELQLQGVGPLPVGTTAIDRADGLLGTRYMQLTPGPSHAMLADHATIFEGAGTYYNGVPEALQLLDPKTRTALRQMLTGFGEGLLGRGSQLNGAIGVAASSARDFNTVADAVLAEPAAASNLLPSTRAGLTALNNARDAITSTFTPAAVAADAVTAQRAPLDQALGMVPTVERGGIDYGLGDPGQRLLASVRTVARAARGVLPVVPSALRAATALLNSAPRPLVETKSVLDVVPGAVPATLGILARLRPQLLPLKQDFVNLIPPVTNFSEHGCDFQNFFTNIRSLVSYGTTPGGNFGPDVGFPLSVIASTNNLGPIAGIRPYPTLDPYPAPCSYSPGPTINTATLGQVLSGVVR